MTYSCGTPLIHISHAQNIDITQVLLENNSNLNGQIRTLSLPQFIDELVPS